MPPHLTLCKAMNHLYLFPLTIILFGCAPNLSRSHRYVIQWASEEAGQVAETAGIANPATYPKIVSNALKGDQESLSKVFQVSPSVDAAGYELQSGILTIVIQTIGDACFSKALKKERPNVIESNIEMLSRDTSLDIKSYPQTMSLK